MNLLFEAITQRQSIVLLESHCIINVKIRNISWNGNIMIKLKNKLDQKNDLSSFDRV